MVEAAGVELEAQAGVSEAGACCRNPEQSEGPGYRMVEAAGVEPASENVTGQEPTYVVTFARRELPRHIRALRLERTRNADR